MKETRTMKRLKQFPKAITKLRKDLRRFSKLEGRKTNLRYALKNLHRRYKQELKEWLDNPQVLGIDSSSCSAINQRKAKKRYLFTTEGKYYNTLNFIIAVGKTKTYIYFIKRNQLYNVDIRELRKLIESDIGHVEFYSDNRHKGTLVLDKKYTMEQERQISRIKRPLYNILENHQSLKSVYYEGKFQMIYVTDMKPREFIKLYIDRMETLGFVVLNYPKIE